MRIGIVVSSEITAVFQTYRDLCHAVIMVDGYEITEYRPQKDLILDIINAGNGNIYSALATQTLINCCHPDCVAHYGIAVSLGDYSKRGKIYIVDDVIHYDFNATTIGEYPDSSTPLIAIDGRNIDWSCAPHRPEHTVCLSGDTLVRNSAQYNFVKSVYPAAQIADMHSAGVSIACNRARVPCLILSCWRLCYRHLRLCLWQDFWRQAHNVPSIPTRLTQQNLGGNHSGGYRFGLYGLDSYLYSGWFYL